MQSLRASTEVTSGNHFNCLLMTNSGSEKSVRHAYMQFTFNRLGKYATYVEFKAGKRGKQSVLDSLSAIRYTDECVSVFKMNYLSTLCDLNV